MIKITSNILKLSSASGIKRIDLKDKDNAIIKKVVDDFCAEIEKIYPKPKEKTEKEKLLEQQALIKARLKEIG